MIEKIFEILGVLVMSVGGIGAIILGFSGWFGKIWANKFYEKERKKQEEYLKTIQNKFDVKLAELNSQLEKSNMQFDILSKERIEVIKSLYAKLVDMQDYLQLYFKEITTKDIEITQESASYSNLMSSITDFMDYNNHNRIFFNDNICKSISEIDAIITILMNLFSFEIKNKAETTEKFKKTSKLMIDKEIPKFKKELEMEFRKLIGVI